MEYVFVFILYSFPGHMIEVGGFKTERECQEERIEIVKDMTTGHKASRCFKVYK